MSNTKTAMSQAANTQGLPLDITDVFSTYLYTGNGADQTITNSIDLAGEGGLVWMKDRFSASLGFHNIYDTEGGTGPNGGRIFGGTALTNVRSTQADGLQSFDSTGFTLGANTYENGSGRSFASWTFRKAPKFFDVVTWTGDGSTNFGGSRLISHGLGSVPGFIIVKRTSEAHGWYCYHRELGATKALTLNSTGTPLTSANWWYNVEPTSTNFSVNFNFNGNNQTYVAYLFAHNDGDGEFGPSGDQDIIKCGSFTDNGSLTTVNLGFEPQWLLVKRTNSAGAWELLDNMRGLPANQFVRTPLLYANDSAVENYSYQQATSDSTGFTWKSGQLSVSGDTLIYVAIRARDGNVVSEPEAATDVFNVNVSSGSTGTVVSTGFPVDMQIQSKRSSPLSGVLSRKQSLISISETAASNAGLTMNGLQTASTAAEFYNDGSYGQLYNNTGFSIGSFYSGASTAYYSFKRARGFFDVVAYTGDNVAGRAINHNLGVTPEMIWVKKRSEATDWNVYHSGLGPTKTIWLNQTSTGNTHPDYWYNTALTSSVFSVGGGNPNNYTTRTYIAYLFATLAGVSKVGSYTGNGSSQTIDCGFTTGARFILIKRTDSTGDWYVWDTTRGIVAGNDPHLSLNTTTAEVTTDDSVDPDNSGFIVNQLAATNINVTSASYIFYAIA